MGQGFNGICHLHLFKRLQQWELLISQELDQKGSRSACKLLHASFIASETGWEGCLQFNWKYYELQSCTCTAWVFHREMGNLWPLRCHCPTIPSSPGYGPWLVGANGSSSHMVKGSWSWALCMLIVEPNCPHFSSNHWLGNLISPTWPGGKAMGSHRKFYIPQHSTMQIQSKKKKSCKFWKGGSVITDVLAKASGWPL